jgi:TRAP-type mannitol/chloroaromatic compound transport system permease small subunit
MTATPTSADGPNPGPSGLRLPETALSRIADRIITFFGEASSWLWTALMLLIVYQVIRRYVFSKGSIMMEEMQWHLYAVGFMLGLAFTEIRERHVRIDVMAEHWPMRLRLLIEGAGILLLLLPFAGFMVYFAVPFVMTSYQLNEVSAAPDGLPFRWVLKSFIVTAFGLVFLAGLSRLSRVVAALRQGG